MTTSTLTLPRKWERIADGRFQIEFEGFTFDARDFGLVEPGADWRLECSAPDGSVGTFQLPSFKAAKQMADKWLGQHA